MNDIELNKVIELARGCSKYNDSTRNGCKKHIMECPDRTCFRFVGSQNEVTAIVTLADLINAKNAKLTQKDKRIAELEANEAWTASEKE